MALLIYDMGKLKIAAVPIPNARKGLGHRAPRRNDLGVQRNKRGLRASRERMTKHCSQPSERCGSGAVPSQRLGYTRSKLCQ